MLFYFNFNFLILFSFFWRLHSELKFQSFYLENLLFFFPGCEGFVSHLNRLHASSSAMSFLLFSIFLGPRHENAPHSVGTTWQMKFMSLEEERTLRRCVIRGNLSSFSHRVSVPAHGQLQPCKLVSGLREAVSKRTTLQAVCSCCGNSGRT